MVLPRRPRAGAGPRHAHVPRAAGLRRSGRPAPAGPLPQGDLGPRHAWHSVVRPQRRRRGRRRAGSRDRRRDEVDLPRARPGEGGFRGHRSGPGGRLLPHHEWRNACRFSRGSRRRAGTVYGDDDRVGRSVRDRGVGSQPGRSAPHRLQDQRGQAPCATVCRSSPTTSPPTSWSRSRWSS